MKEYRNPENVHPPVAGYTHQIEIRGPERLLFLSGQIGRREDGLKGHQPCMTLVYVAALASPIYKVELDGLASRAE